MMTLRLTALLTCLLLPLAAAAQTTASQRFEGTLVLMTGQAEVEVANDEAVASLFVEVQDADLQRAQSQVNQRIADATAAVRRADPKGEVQSAGYGSYPVYGRDGGRKITGWRARQTISLRTSDLAALPRAVAAAQQHAALGGIQRAIANLNQRVAAAAQAMKVAPERVRSEELNFGVQGHERPPIVARAMEMKAAGDAMPEPQFDAGRSTQQMTVTARLRFLVP
jgi:uncharacterized protein